MASDAIEIVDPDPAWPAKFADEKRRVAEALAGETLLAVEHVGSTAVPGSAAKPVIDMMIVVPSVDEARNRFPAALKPLDYVFWADNPDADRLFFVKGMPPFGDGRTHHVHVCEPGRLMADRLAFRDYLRAHPDEVLRYSALKRELAAQHGEDREAYTRGKDGFVARILELAKSA
ncbi:GrpB family protein [Parasphingopyxis algicola]|uniref:GrpB family protein n=1 Tax=Parasphingopyxis algicola TaxID=2026624 RepID=UPI0015A44163|nr:GrpB family protein [Parasphingopyxis algicola]QLC26099.1 GrpB family protein [Parasphingopyxis algicola]